MLSKLNLESIQRTCLRTGGSKTQGGRTLSLLNLRGHTFQVNLEHENRTVSVDCSRAGEPLRYVVR